ncbi:hypothetical protein V3C99_014895 [Haemonchus contortus]
MALQLAVVVLLCSLVAVTMGQQDDSDSAPFSGPLLQPSYGLGWRGYVLPMYNGEKKWASDENTIPSSHAQLLGNEYLSRIERSMTEKMKSLKGRYSGQIRDILFGK